MEKEQVKFFAHVHQAIREVAVQPQELMKIADAILFVVRNQNKELAKKIEGVDSDKDSQLKDIKADLEKKEKSLSKVIEDTKNASEKTFNRKLKKLGEEIASIADLIPAPTDLTEIEKKISEVEGKIPVIPKIEKLKPEELRDLLQSLKDEKRLDASAIKNLPEFTREIVQHVGFPETQIKAGTNITVRKDASGSWVISSTATGSGITVETPTGAVNGSNVTFTVTSAPQWIVVDGITYFENNGYTRSGLTLTLLTPPVQYIRSFY